MDCVICLAAMATIVVVPCRHCCLCTDCVDALPAGPSTQKKHCPICRTAAAFFVSITHVTATGQMSTSAMVEV